MRSGSVLLYSLSACAHKRLVNLLCDEVCFCSCVASAGSFWLCVSDVAVPRFLTLVRVARKIANERLMSFT